MILEPKDVEVTVLHDAALVAFHFEDDTSVGRRKYVLQKNT